MSGTLHDIGIDYGEAPEGKLHDQRMRESLKLAIVHWLQDHPGEHQFTHIVNALRKRGYDVRSAALIIRDGRNTFRSRNPYDPEAPSKTRSASCNYVSLVPSLYHRVWQG